MLLGLFKKKVKMVKVKRVRKKKTKTSAKAKTSKDVKKKVKTKKTHKATVAKKRSKAMPQIVGRVTHYFPHVKAGVISVTKGVISLGDTLHLKGHTTDFKQKIKSMQINNAPINKAKAGQEIGVLLRSRVRHNDVVYKV